MGKPNFFVIGAPKCGTTSLASWLAEHPNIYMSPVKEPHFFSSDLNCSMVPNRHVYEQLFRGVMTEHKAIGEASVWYLISKVAVPRIEKDLPGSKYIVMVRNPVDMAYSLHEQQLVTGNEHIKSFLDAWRLSEERARGEVVTRRCREPKLLDYKSVCRLGKQLERLFENIPRERTLTLILDDVKENPRREYIKVLEFLGVPDDGRKEFPVKNSAKELRWPRLYYALREVGRACGVKRWLGTPGVWRLAKAIIVINTRFRAREAMPLGIRAELVEYFREDIYLLEKLLNRDLSAWLDLR